jgi:DNA-binding NarL/FixJ family response regulator
MPKPRILIIEDEALTVAALKHELTALGYEIAGAADNAPEAMKVADTCRPDLVLMDIQLAGPVSGVVAAIAIRGLLHIPVIFLTAHSDNKTVSSAVRAGAFGYIVKPYTAAGLKAAIATALHKHQTELDTRAQSAAAPTTT